MCVGLKMVFLSVTYYTGQLPLMFLMGLQDVKSLVCGCYFAHNANTRKIKYFKNTGDRWKF